MQNRLEELNKELSGIIEKLQQWKIAQAQIESTRKLNLKAIEERRILVKQLEKEEKDVEKLQKLTLTNFIHTLIKDKEEKLTIEEAEAIKVKAELDQLNYNIEENIQRMNVLSQSTETFVELEEQYNVLFAEKKAIIEKVDPDKWGKIREYDEQQAVTQLQLKEIEEAVRAGENLLSQMRSVEGSLKSAENWGTYDIWGGGLFASMAKRDHMEDAKSKLEGAQYAIARFNQELADVNRTIQADLNIGDFMSFADWFFDGFFVDIAIQNKINDAQDKVKNLKRKIDTIQLELKRETEVLTEKTETIKNACDELVVHTELTK